MNHRQNVLTILLPRNSSETWTTTDTQIEESLMPLIRGFSGGSGRFYTWITSTKWQSRSKKQRHPSSPQPSKRCRFCAPSNMQHDRSPKSPAIHYETTMQSTTWTTVIEKDPMIANMGLHTAWKKAQNRASLWTRPCSLVSQKREKQRNRQTQILCTAKIQI